MTDYPNAKHFYHPLAIDGEHDNDAKANLIGDYTTPVIASLLTDSTHLNSTAKFWVVTRMLIQIAWTGIADPDNYGDLNLSAGSLGILFRVKDGSNNVLFDFTSGRPIKGCGDYGRLAGIDNVVLAKGSGNHHSIIRWTIAKSGYPLVLSATEGHTFEALIEGDFSGGTLTKHFLNVQGYKSRRRP